MWGLGCVALGRQWLRGDRLLLWRGEYPTNVTTFQRAAELFGLAITFLPASDLQAPGGADLAALEHELRRGGVRLCAISAVQFQTGVRAPLAEIAALCHEHGAELVVDAVQAAGAVPLDVRAMDIDYLAAGAHKWLCGADGVGMLYVSRARLPALRPPVTGAMSYDGAMDLLAAGPGHLRYDRALRGDAKRFEGGMQSSTSCAALEASLDLLLALGVGEIHRHVNAYLDVLEPQLVARGFVSMRLPEVARRSCILSLQPPPGRDAPALASALAAHGIVCACPDGLLRISPHWPNAEREIPDVVGAVDDVLRE
jgi:selenocysteine lyase/cysteine desulfurase